MKYINYILNAYSEDNILIFLFGCLMIYVLIFLINIIPLAITMGFNNEDISDLNFQTKQDILKTTFFLFIPFLPSLIFGPIYLAKKWNDLPDDKNDIKYE